MTAVVPTEKPTGALALTADQHDWTPAQKAALVQLGLADAPAADLQVFLHQAQRTGLDPFLKQIYMIGRWDGRSQKNKYTIQAAIDGLRIVAERHGQYGGGDGPYWCGEDGAWKDMWTGNKPPIAAKVGVIRKDWGKPMYAVALFSEYAARKKDGNLEPMWANRPAGQLAKCAEALALRKAFPHDLSGIYTGDEMAQADNPHVRLVIDQQPDDKATVVEQVKAEPAVSGDVDWDAEIAKCNGDKAALGALWKRVPKDSDARAKIQAAATSPKVVEEMPTIVDAEIVEDTPPARPAKPTKLEKARSVLEIFNALLDVSDPADADDLIADAARVDVSGFLSDEVREVLDIEGKGRLVLPEFGKLVSGYTFRRGVSVNATIKGDAA